MVHLCCMYGAYHVLIKFVNSKHDFFIQNLEHLLIEPQQQAWSVFAEAYQADARDFGVSVPHYSLPEYLYWNLHFDDPIPLQCQPVSHLHLNAMPFRNSSLHMN